MTCKTCHIFMSVNPSISNLH